MIKKQKRSSLVLLLVLQYLLSVSWQRPQFILDKVYRYSAPLTILCWAHLSTILQLGDNTEMQYIKTPSHSSAEGFHDAVKK